MYLDEVVEEIVRASRILADGKRVGIAVTTVHSASFTGDEELVRRLVANLLDNAVRHAPPDTTVDVTLEETADGYTVSVSDRGPGIAPEFQPYIFERFNRGDAARPADGGAGLGLALARWIARLHGGDVSAGSLLDSGHDLQGVPLPLRPGLTVSQSDVA